LTASEIERDISHLFFVIDVDANNSAVDEYGLTFYRIAAFEPYYGRQYLVRLDIFGYAIVLKSQAAYILFWTACPVRAGDHYHSSTQPCSLLYTVNHKKELTYFCL